MFGKGSSEVTLIALIWMNGYINVKLRFVRPHRCLCPVTGHLLELQLTWFVITASVLSSGFNEYGDFLGCHCYRRTSFTQKSYSLSKTSLRIRYTLNTRKKSSMISGMAICFCISWGGVRLSPLATATSIGPIGPAPDDG
jgi:hypothetical protein